MHLQTIFTSFCFLNVKLYPTVQKKKKPTSKYANISVLSPSGVIYRQVKCTACVFSLNIESTQVQPETFTAIFSLYPGVKDEAEGGCCG